MIPLLKMLSRLSVYLLLVTYSISWHQVLSNTCPTISSPNCNCTNGTMEVYCMGRNVTKVPNFATNAAILHVGNGNIDIIDNIPYSKLITLYLENDHIRYVKDHAFKGLGNLKNLYLKNNYISGLTNLTFAGLKNLRTIVLSLNPIYQLKGNIFSVANTPKITEIKLEEAMLYEVEPMAFSHLLDLVYIGLANNRLRHIPFFNRLDELDALHTLDLSGNRIESLAHSGLGNLKNLQTLLLNSNRITTITHYDFAGGLDITLNLLNLQHNDISSVDPVAFVNLGNLSQLELDYNLLTYLPWEELPWNNLVRLTLSKNPWDCSCNNSWMVEDINRSLRNFNNNNQTTCATPVTVMNQPVYSVPMDTFKCPNPHHHTVKTSVLISVGLIVSLLLLLAACVIYCKVLKRKRKDYNQPYTKVTASSGIHM